MICKSATTPNSTYTNRPEAWKRGNQYASRHYLLALLATGMLLGPVVGAVRAEDGMAITPTEVGTTAPAVIAPRVALPEVKKVEEAAPSTTAATTEPMAVVTPVAAPATTLAAPAVPATTIAETTVSATTVPAATVPAVAEPMVAVPPPAPETMAPTTGPVVTAPATTETTAATLPVVATEPATTAATTATTASAPATTTAAGVTTPLPASTAGALKTDGKTYEVTGLTISYASENKSHPAASALLDQEVVLGLVNDGFVAPRAGMPTARVKLSQIGKTPPMRLYGSAFKPIYEAITKGLNARGLIGVFVVASPTDIDSHDNDIRPAGQGELHILVYTSRVTQVRTVATGTQGGGGPRVDNPRLERIRENSPVKPGPLDLLRKDVLDDYVLRLNRQPGRRVDVAVSGTDTPGDVTLDYLVAENRPWYVYAQVSNTGTKQTDLWRERFGVVDNQLTGHDDVLSLDYVTASFQKSHAVVVSYDTPFFKLDRVRNKVYGSWSEFTASDVGLTHENFTGDEWTMGDEISVNLYQHRELFIDLVAGARYEHVSVNNVTFNAQGTGDYIMPYIGVREERQTDTFATFADMTLTGGFSGTNKDSLEALGRPKVDQDFVVLQADASHSFYIEPLLDPNGFSAGKSTLAHELFFSVRGQYAFNYRLIPQSEEVVGGLYTVRGYPESIAAGDTIVVGTAEYRFHLPRALTIQPDPNKTKLFGQPFRFSPQQPYGRPDWDLIARAFFDAGRAMNTRSLPFETNATLVGTGVGLELQIKQNFNFRVDWGVALTDVPGEVNAGSNRVHFSATFLY